MIRYSPMAPAGVLLLRRRLALFAALTIPLVLLFLGAIIRWVRFADGSELYSYLLLVPLVSAYLIWSSRKSIPVPDSPKRAGGVLLGLLGALLVAFAAWCRTRGTVVAPEDSIALEMLSLLSFLVAIGWFVFGGQALYAVAFPLGFLAFASPFPSWLMDGVVTLLQYGSAEAAFVLIYISGIPILRTGLVFELPGINMHVAPQCSGIHSTLVLFIVSLVAGHLFLKRPWARLLLSVAVLPLALLRNGLRIFTIAQLCVQVHPDMINSYIHKQGGPIFFALSLIPFFLLLFYLRRIEGRSTPVPSQQTL